MHNGTYHNAYQSFYQTFGGLDEYKVYGLDGLGGVKEDIVRILSVIPGGKDIVGRLNEIEAYIRSQAEAGAKQAIPTIKDEVKKTVMPFVIASMVLGVTGIAIGLASLRKAR